jgi:hypothetical protein
LPETEEQTAAECTNLVSAMLAPLREVAGVEKAVPAIHVARSGCLR